MSDLLDEEYYDLVKKLKIKFPSDSVALPTCLLPPKYVRVVAAATAAEPRQKGTLRAPS